MVGERLVHLEQHALGREVDLHRFADGHDELDEPQRAVEIGRRGGAARRGVGGEEAAVAGEPGMWRDAQEAAFVEGAVIERREAVGEHGHRRVGQLAVLIDEADLAGLLDDQREAVRQRCVADGLGEAFGDELERDARRFGEDRDGEGCGGSDGESEVLHRMGGKLGARSAEESPDPWMIRVGKKPAVVDPAAPQRAPQPNSTAEASWWRSSRKPRGNGACPGPSEGFQDHAAGDPPTPPYSRDANGLMSCNAFTFSGRAKTAPTEPWRSINLSGVLAWRRSWTLVWDCRCSFNTGFAAAAVWTATGIR